MSDFKQFRTMIKSIGGVWNGDDVYFSQMRDGYSASYKPNYPKYYTKDMIIQTLPSVKAISYCFVFIKSKSLYEEGLIRDNPGKKKIRRETK